MAIEVKKLNDTWASWRDEWEAADVEKALAYAGLKNWTFDHWSDGDMQFMHKDPVPFDDLAKLRIAFTPLRMIIEAMIDQDLLDEQDEAWKQAGSDSRQRQAIPLMILITMSWNSTSDPEAV